MSNGLYEFPKWNCKSGFIQMFPEYRKNWMPQNIQSLKSYAIIWIWDMAMVNGDIFIQQMLSVGIPKIYTLIKAENYTQVAKILTRTV